MTPFKVVKHAIEIGRPGQLLVRFEKLGNSDMHTLKWNRTSPGDHQYREMLDELGYHWVRNVARNMGQVRGHPLEDWNSLDRYCWPNPDDLAFYEEMKARFEGSEGKNVCAVFSYYWSRRCMLFTDSRTS